MVKAAAAVSACAAALVVVVGGAATPAFAHAELLSTQPAAGEKLDTAPEQVVLTFNETVDPPKDAIEVFDSDGDQVKTNRPAHPGGEGVKVAVDLPDLDDGAYVVTWRVASADSHPIRGAYTFRIGDAADAAEADALMTKLVASEGGDTTVGTLFGAVRFAGFVGMVLLVGGLLVVTFVWPGGADDRRARRLMTAGWVTWLVATLLSFGFQGAYSEGDGLGGVLKAGSIGDVLGTRPGRVWLARLLLLVLVAVAAPILRRRRDRTGAGLVVALSLALIATISLAGHAGSGDWAPLAFVVDLLHLGGVSFWVGGLILLYAVVLRPASGPGASTVSAAAAVTEARAEPVGGATDEQAGAVERFSTLAFAAVVVIVLSGTIQGFRQTRSLDALFDTTYGRVLIVKVLLFSLMLLGGAASRTWVRRRKAARAAVGKGDGDGAAGKATAAPSLRSLRLSVGLETAVAALVLAVTAVLVNTVPGKDAASPTFSTEVHGSNVLIEVEVSPPKAGVADIEIDVQSHLGEPYEPEEVTASMALPSRDLPPIPVPLKAKSGATGVYTADDVEIPYPGTWDLAVNVRVSEFDQDSLKAQIPVK
jgi:copper transport protein